MGKLRVAVVGFGKMGMVHAGILNVMPDVELVAICEKSGLVRKFLRKALSNVAVVDDVSELSGYGLDAVYVTTPIAAHFPIVKSLYEKGIAKNIFVEKTLASNFGEAEELCRLAETHGGATMVGYLRRFCVTFMKAKALLESGALGELSAFRAYAFSSDFYGVGADAKIKVPSVGVVRELGCHALDLALWLFGSLKVENARVEALINGSVADSAHFAVKVSDGFSGEFDVSWCVDGYRLPEVGFSVEGSKGCLCVNDDAVELKFKSGGSRKWFRHDLNDTVGFWLGIPEYYRENEHFVQSLIRGVKPTPSFEAAGEVDRLIDEVSAKAMSHGQ
ncbi:MAG: Gfo/Idh/MocA family oxidoreductase [Candidatus Bathyarchaeia archaeon]